MPTGPSHRDRSAAWRQQASARLPSDAASPEPTDSGLGPQHPATLAEDRRLGRWAIGQRARTGASPFGAGPPEPQSDRQRQACGQNTSVARRPGAGGHQPPTALRACSAATGTPATGATDSRPTLGVDPKASVKRQGASRRGHREKGPLRGANREAGAKGGASAERDPSARETSHNSLGSADLLVACDRRAVPAPSYRSR